MTEQDREFLQMFIETEVRRLLVEVLDGFLDRRLEERQDLEEDNAA